MNQFQQCINLLKKECKEIISYKLKNKENSKLVFFGVSNLFQRLLYDFLRCDIYPDYICDNDIKKHGKDIESYIIYNPEILFNQNEEFIVIITSSFIDEIKSQLTKYYNIKAIYAYNQINYNIKYKFVEQKITKSVNYNILNFKEKPLISIILLNYYENEEWLKSAINSIQNQWYKNWEIFLIYTSNINNKMVKYLESINNKRIKYLEIKTDFSSNINEAFKLVSGEYFTIVHGHDKITNNALYEVVKVINETKADFIYSDEDKINIDNTFCEPHFKPDFSPDTLLSYNYIKHLAIIKKSFIDMIDGYNSEFDGAFEYDLYLRIVEKTSNIQHIQKVLYHSRKIENSTINKFNNILSSEKKVIRQSFKRRDINAKVKDGKYPGIYKIEYILDKQPLVSIIIPFKDKPELLKMCIDSILEKTTYQNFQIIGISNNSKEEKVFNLMKKYESKDKRIKFYELNIPFNYSKINNYAVNNYVTGEHIILLNNDIKIISSNWIEEMLMHSQREEIGCVGAKLYYPDKRIQHAGVIIGLYGCAGYSHKYYNYNSNGYSFRLVSIQNMSAVTAACLMIKTKIYKELNGLDEINLEVAFNDVDFCLRVQENGYRNIFTPYCEAYHYESISRGKENTPIKMNRFKKEIEYIKKRYSKILEKGDPFYNPNLTLIREDFSIK